MIFIMIIILGQLLMIEIKKSEVSSTGSEKEWKIEELEFERIRYSPLILDSKGNPHLYFMENDTFYLKKLKNNRWQTNIKGFKIGDDVKGLSITFDLKDNIHICYYKRYEKKIKYAKLENNQWNLQIIDQDCNLPCIPSINIDPFGNPYICYYNRIAPSYGNLKFAKKIDNKWITEIIDSSDDVGGNPKIIFNSESNPIIYYFDFTNNCLKMAKYNSIDWIIQKFDPIDNLSWSSISKYPFFFYSISIDSLFNPHICYLNESNKTLMYANWTGNNWIFKTIETFNWLTEYYYYSLELDSYNNPHICYNHQYHDELKYTKWNGDNWSTEIIDSEFDNIVIYSFSLDSKENPKIIYYFDDSSTHREGIKFARINDNNNSRRISGFEANYLIIIVGLVLIILKKNLNHTNEKEQRKFRELY